MKKQFVLTCLLLLFFSYGCRNGKPNEETGNLPVEVITQRLSRSIIADDISLSGSIEGNKTIKLGFLVAGRINYMAREEGQPVYKGQWLAGLDPTSYSIAKELADIQVGQVEDEYNRLKLMHDNNSLSESDFVKITSGLEQARAQQKMQEKNLKETKIYSPVDGVVLMRLAEPGEITGVGMPVLVVSEINKVKVNAFIPENDLYKIITGQDVQIRVSSLDTIYHGRIIEVGSGADPASRSFPVKIEVENSGLLLRPGMIAEVYAESPDRRSVLIIPAEAVLHDFDNQSFVFVVDTVKNMVFKRNVSPGKIYKNLVEIVTGLGEGESIVTGGQHKLVDGSLVRIVK